jgi:branched-chain amino acid transport system substrate-binding protein
MYAAVSLCANNYTRRFKMKERKVRLIVSLLCLALVITVLPIIGNSTSTQASEKEPIKLGLLTILSGPVYLYTVGQKILAMLAIEDVNNDGGINGYPLKLSTADSGKLAEGTVTGYRKLVTSEDVVAVVGPFFDFQYKSVVPVAKAMGCMVTMLTSSETGYFKDASPWGVRIEGDRNDTAPIGFQAMRDYVKLYPKVRKVGIFYTKDTPFLQDQARVWEENLTKFGLILAEKIDVPYNTPDWAPYVTRMKGLNPDGIFVVLGTDDCIRFCTQADKQGLNVPVLGSVHSCCATFISASGSLMEKMGWVSCQDTWFMNPKNQAIFGRFKVELKKEIPQAKMWATKSDRLAYDYVWLFAKAMRDEKVTPKMPLAEARKKIAHYIAKLTEVDLPISGRVKLDPVRHESVRQYDTVIVKNGAWVPYK